MYCLLEFRGLNLDNLVTGDCDFQGVNNVEKFISRQKETL